MNLIKFWLPQLYGLRNSRKIVNINKDEGMEINFLLRRKHRAPGKKYKNTDKTYLTKLK